VAFIFRRWSSKRYGCEWEKVIVYQLACSKYRLTVNKPQLAIETPSYLKMSPYPAEVLKIKKKKHRLLNHSVQSLEYNCIDQIKKPLQGKKRISITAVMCKINITLGGEMLFLCTKAPLATLRSRVQCRRNQNSMPNEVLL
jgi:hypothetical protein